MTSGTAWPVEVPADLTAVIGRLSCAASTPPKLLDEATQCQLLSQNSGRIHVQCCVDGGLCCGQAERKRVLVLCGGLNAAGINSPGVRLIDNLDLDIVELDGGQNVGEYMAASTASASVEALGKREGEPGQNDVDRERLESGRKPVDRMVGLRGRGNRDARRLHGLIPTGQEVREQNAHRISRGLGCLGLDQARQSGRRDGVRSKIEILCRGRSDLIAHERGHERRRAEIDTETGRAWNQDVRRQLNTSAVRSVARQIEVGQRRTEHCKAPSAPGRHEQSAAPTIVEGLKSDGLRERHPIELRAESRDSQRVGRKEPFERRIVQDVGRKAAARPSQQARQRSWGNG